EDAAQVLPAARQAANRLLDPATFRILEGDRYVEAAPLAADKGATVDWILQRYRVEHDLPVGFGDDNKDDSAFAAIHRHSGFAIGVDERYPLPEADARLRSYADVRVWLRSFIDAAS
ncbi:MAG: trehalose-phosphatase, partial [Anaerolineae bacterium]